MNRSSREIAAQLSLLPVILILFLTLFLYPAYAQSLRDIPDDNLAYPVLLISIQADTPYSGSGFYYNNDQAIFFITARHILFEETSAVVTKEFSIPASLKHRIEAREDEKTKGNVLLSFYGVMSDSERDEFKAAQKSDLDKTVIDRLHRDSQKLKLKINTATLFSYPPKPEQTGLNEIVLELAKLYQSGKIKYHLSADVALIEFGTTKKGEEHKSWEPLDGATYKGAGIVGLEKTGVKMFDDVLVGNTVYTFGYPTSLSINPFLDIKLPLLRRGAVAGKNTFLKVIILDCPAFAGNSGGLVIEARQVDIGNRKFEAIGLITNFVPYLPKLQNSGYSIAVPMDFVLELIKGEAK